MTKPFTIQIKDGVFGWKMDTCAAAVLVVEFPFEDFKRCREIVSAHIQAAYDRGDLMGVFGGMMNATAQFALIQSGMSREDALDLSQRVRLESGVYNGALFGYAMFSTVRVLKSRPENTMEAAMRGDKTKWCRPMKGVATVLDLGACFAGKVR